MAVVGSRIVSCCLVVALCVLMVTMACGVRCEAEALRLTDGAPLVGMYYFAHWWEPWKSSDDKALGDLVQLKRMGYNTVFLDHQWSQMIADDWKLLDREHRLARQAGMRILPWLSSKVWRDIGETDSRRDLLKTMYGADVTMGIGREGQINRTKPYDPAVIAAAVRYCEQYIDRYLKDGALLHVKWSDGKMHPVVAPTVELEWEGSCDPKTNQLFRSWLRRRYGNDIARLNRKWGTDLSSFESVDICDRKLFDLEAHCNNHAAHPRAVEDHVEFRSQVSDNCLLEVKKRLKRRYPDLLIATELPFQFGASHSHAVSYRIHNGANPSSAHHADILVIRAVEPLTACEEQLLKEYKKRSGQHVILTYRTFDWWGKAIEKGERGCGDMKKTYADAAARLAEGFGLYSWNEMMDTHIVPDQDPPAHPTSRITAHESAVVVKAAQEMAEEFVRAANADGYR